MKNVKNYEKSSCPQNSCPQFWGRKWLRQFYGHLGKIALLSAGKTHVRKIPPFRGGGVGGGGSADFIFMGAGIFLKKFMKNVKNSETILPFSCCPLVLDASFLLTVEGLFAYGSSFLLTVGEL